MTILGKKNGELSGVPPRGSDIQVDMLACNETTAYLKVEEAAPQTRAKVSGGGGSKRLFGIRHNAADREDVVTVERAGPDSVKVIVNEPNSVQALILRYRQGDSEVEHLVWLQTLQLSGAKHIKNTDKQYTISVPQRMMNRIRDCVDPCTLAAVTTNTIPGTTRGIIKLEAVHLETEGIQFCVNMLERQRGAEYGLTNMEAGIAAITEATNTFVQLGADMAKCEDAIKKAKGKEDKRGLEGAEDQLRNTKKKRDDAFLSIIREVESAVGKSTLPKLQELRTAKPLRYEEVCACAADAQNRLRKQIETASGGLNVNCAASVTHVVVTSSNQPIVEWKQ